MPSTARSMTDFSDSRVEWKVWVEVFRCEARVIRLVVRDSCSLRWVVRVWSFVVVFVGGVGCVGCGCGCVDDGVAR